ncbi:hypothetical protein WP3W18E06_P60380 (plasmid) [Raoultella ornithinolytica]|nr:hypothetical protein WP3W18E06_P60380 [Raoultella ornithinolytica]
MIILHGQQAPVTDPPVHQTGIDGRRKRGGDALRIPVDDFRYLREGASGRPADRHIPPLSATPERKAGGYLTVSQPLRMRICLHRKEMQTSRGSRQPPGAGEQQRCPAIRQRLTKLFRKREDFHATERAAGGKPAGYGFGGDGRHINSVGPASLAQHPVAVTQNKRVKGFFFIIIVSVRVISPRRVAGRSAVSFSVMPALLLYPPGGALRFPAPGDCDPVRSIPCPTMPVRR